LWANLHLLFWLSLLPFATGWMGENQFEMNTVITYAILADVCGIAYYILLVSIKKANSWNKELLKVLHAQSKKGILSNILNTLAIPAAFIHPALSGAFIITVYMLWLIPDRNIEKAIGTE
jgi:uncharacterized membrane protein